MKTVLAFNRVSIIFCLIAIFTVYLVSCSELISKLATVEKLKKVLFRAFTLNCSFYLVIIIDII